MTQEPERDRAMGAFARMLMMTDEQTIGRELQEFLGDPETDQEIQSSRATLLALCGPMILALALSNAEQGPQRVAVLEMVGDAETNKPHHVFLARLVVTHLNKDKAMWEDLTAAHLRVHGEDMVRSVLVASFEYVHGEITSVRGYQQVLRRLSKLR